MQEINNKMEQKEVEFLIEDVTPEIIQDGEEIKPVMTVTKSHSG